VILPTDCKQQVDEDLQADQLEGVTIHYASRIEDVLAVALPLLKARPDLRPVEAAELAAKTWEVR